MARQPNLDYATLKHCQFVGGNKERTIVQTLTGTYTIDSDSPQVLALDPGGADRSVVLPAETKGLWYVVTNTADADEDLNIYEDGASTIIATVQPSETVEVICPDGTTWRAPGRGSGGGSGFLVVTDAATYTVLASNSGKTHIMPDLTADCTITLPTEAAGLEFEFIYGGVAADAQDWTFLTTGNTNYYLGGVLHLDSDADAAADEVVPLYPDGNSNSSLNVLTPNCGTSVKFWCDGTNWYLNGQVVSATVPAFADQ